MSIEIKVPALPESVSDATLVAWHKSVGESVSRDENLVDLETDKVVLEVPAPANGVLQEIKVDDGATVTAGDVLAILAEGESAGAAAAEPEQAEVPANRPVVHTATSMSCRLSSTAARRPAAPLPPTIIAISVSRMPNTSIRIAIAVGIVGIERRVARIDRWAVRQQCMGECRSTVGRNTESCRRSRRLATPRADRCPLRGPSGSRPRWRR